MSLKNYNKDKNVFKAAQERIAKTFDEFDNIVLSFSGGKDSTVMLHLTAEEAIKRNRKIGLMIIDLEAQYKHTITHVEKMVSQYKDVFDVHWICLPMSLRNAASNFQPRWICWDLDKNKDWVREMPKNENVKSDLSVYPFFVKGMEFEEFVVLFAKWYGGYDTNTAILVGIRADESLNRFRTIASKYKEKYKDLQFTTKIVESVYNVYPLYDWKTSDIWVYHRKFPEKGHNLIYDLMHQAGVKPSQQRLCQPYGDDQRKGLWLYHLLEPETWYKVVARVNGVNSCALYNDESGMINGENKINKPQGHTYKSFCNLLLATLPRKTREHYIKRFQSFLKGWHGRGYVNGIPDEAPPSLESKHWAPSYRRLCKVLLRNDYWCKGLGLTQPKSEAYGKYLKIRDSRKACTAEESL